MPKKPASLQGLFVEELRDLYDAEKQLVKALPKMAKSVTDDELENALQEHLEVTRGQAQRLEQIFESMDTKARSKPCKGMKGLVEEGQEIIEEHDDMLLDSAVTSAARKVEHYEMMGYESARSLAQELGLREAAQMLQQTLEEETQADRLLAQISKRLTKEAARGQMMESREMEQGGDRRGRSAGSRQSKGSSRGKSAGKSASSSRSSGKSARPLTDHEEIRQWAEERGAKPACVRGTGSRGDTGMIRLDFPGWSGEESLQPISWDDWFGKFDESNLALMVQETTARGQKSNFNKLVKRETASKPKVRTAR